MSAFSSRSKSASARSAPDAVGRGVIGHDPEGPPVLFVLAGNSLGQTPVGVEGAPHWMDLRRLISLDAVGEPAGSKLPIEASFDGGPQLVAMWPEPFCDQVTARLRELLDSGQMIPKGADGPTDAAPAASQGAKAVSAAAPVAAQPVAPRTGPAPARTAAPVGQPAPVAAAPAPDPAPVAPAPAAPAAAAPVTAAPVMAQPGASDADAPLWASTDERPLPGDGPRLLGVEGSSAAGELTLEDVVYHGGYPGQTKKRKKCVAVLDAGGVSVNGPNGPDFRLGWEVVRSVEAQNADEAKFRLGVKVKRNSTVVVLDCEQGVTIVIEARDVSTMPLKGALHELLDGGSVSVA